MAVMRLLMMNGGMSGRAMASARAYRSLLVLASCLCVIGASGTSGAQSVATTPAAIGDQLFFFYDASGPRVPFLSVSNPSGSAVDVEMAFHAEDGGRHLTSFILPAWGNRVVDPLTIGGVPGTSGLAIVTPVTSGTAQPVVPPNPLSGSVTQANTDLGAAFGGNAVGRLAVTAGGTRASPGANVDGTTVRYQRLEPPGLAIPTYYNPATLDPPENDGNRVIVVAFADAYGARFDPVAPTGSLAWSLYDSSGAQVGSGNAPLSTVVFDTSLQALAGPGALTSSGKAFFLYAPGTGEQSNVFGFFSQSLSAFGAGERMPAAAAPPA